MATVTGESSLYMMVWLTDPMDLLRVEQQLLDGFDGVAILDRRIIMRTFRYHGVQLSEDGRFAGVVPMAY
ncbi:hypothetical protein ACH9EU_17140 [Kocuria sp. M1R5S2]